MPQTLKGKPGDVFRHDSAPSPIHSYNTTLTHAFDCSLEPLGVPLLTAVLPGFVTM